MGFLLFFWGFKVVSWLVGSDLEMLSWSSLIMEDGKKKEIFARLELFRFRCSLGWWGFGGDYLIVRLDILHRS